MSARTVLITTANHANCFNLYVMPTGRSVVDEYAAPAMIAMEMVQMTSSYLKTLEVTEMNNV